MGNCTIWLCDKLRRKANQCRKRLSDGKFSFLYPTAIYRARKYEWARRGGTVNIFDEHVYDRHWIIKSRRTDSSNNLLSLHIDGRPYLHIAFITRCTFYVALITNFFTVRGSQQFVPLSSSSSDKSIFIISDYNCFISFIKIRGIPTARIHISIDND